MTLASNINELVETLPLGVIYPAIIDCDERKYILSRRSRYAITPKGQRELERIKRENPDLLRKF